MLTEEQLAQRLRAALERYTMDVEPPPGLLDAVHAELAAAPHARSRARWRQALAGAAALTVAAAVAVAALVLIGHGARPSPPAATTPTARRGQTATRRVSPTVVRVSAVAAPVRLSLGRLGRYCNAPNGELVACTAGERAVTPQPQRLVTITVLARLGAGDHSWYAWSFTAPPGCAQASSGGPTRAPVRPGTRLTFQALMPPGCRGIAKASVVYVTAAPGSDSERFAQVGRATAIVP